LRFDESGGKPPHSKWTRLGKLVERFSCPLPLHFSG